MKATHRIAWLILALVGVLPPVVLAQSGESRTTRAAAGKPARTASEPVTDIDKLFEAQNRQGTATVSVDAAVLRSTRDAANQVHDKTEEQRRERERERASHANAGNDGSASVHVAGNASAAGVAAIRSESYDNAGRQTSGYWIECRGGRKVRIYRGAWDGKGDWYSPAGLGTFNFIASASLSVEDVAKKVCR